MVNSRKIYCIAIKLVKQLEGSLFTLYLYSRTIVINWIVFLFTSAYCLGRETWSKRHVNQARKSCYCFTSDSSTHLTTQVSVLVTCNTIGHKTKNIRIAREENKVYTHFETALDAWWEIYASKYKRTYNIHRGLKDEEISFWHPQLRYPVLKYIAIIFFRYYFLLILNIFQTLCMIRGFEFEQTRIAQYIINNLH